MKWMQWLAIGVADYAQAMVWQVQSLRRRRHREGLVGGGRGNKRPVLIIPGVFEPWLFMGAIIRALRADGHPVHVLDVLGYNVGEIPAAARHAQEYLQTHGLRDVVVVAHSKGGLIGKYLVTNLDPKRRVKRLVAVATPFAGSVYARFFPIRVVRDFAPRAKVIQELGRETVANSRIVSVYGTFDPNIPEGSRLEGAHNVELEVAGHFRILKNPEVVQAVREYVGVGAPKNSRVWGAL